MATKITCFFELGTIYGDDVTYRVAGWSESYINTGGGFNDASFDKKVQDLMDARCRLLAKQGSIVAYRYQTVTPDAKPGRSAVYLSAKKGNAQYPTDVPQMAFVARGHNDGQNMRLIELRGFPDSLVVTGEAKLTPDMTTNWKNFAKLLKEGGWAFRGIKKDVLTVDVDNVTAGGVVTMKDDFAGPGIGKKIQVIRTKQDEGRDDYYGYIGTQDVQANVRTLTVKNWKGGACTGGRIRAYSHDFFPFTFIEEEAVFLRKVGRPFFQYRGKASKRA